MDNAYGTFAYFYDELMKDAPYEKWMSLLHTTITLHREMQQLQRSEPIIIADIGCGTGTLCFSLAKEGHQVIGVDLSEDMLTVGEEKRSQISLPIQRRIQFLCQNMQELRLPKPVDIAYSFCDSLNYLQSLSEFDATLKRIAASLKNDGLFIFDLLSLDKMKRLGKQKNFEVNEDIVCVWENTWDDKDGCLHHDVSILIKEEDDRYRRFDEYHTQRGFSIDEVRDLLESNHFDIIKELSDFSPDKSLELAMDRYLWIVKKR